MAPCILHLAGEVQPAHLLPQRDTSLGIGVVLMSMHWCGSSVWCSLSTTRRRLAQHYANVCVYVWCTHMCDRMWDRMCDRMCGAG